MTAVTEYLLKLGLTPTQAKAMAVLFKGDQLTAKEVSTSASVSYTKVYKALEELANLGVVKVRLDKPKLYQSIQPAHVIKILIEVQEKGLKEIKHSTDDVLKQIETGYTVEEKQDLGSHVWLYQSTSGTFEGATGVAADAKHSLKFVGSKQNYLLFFTHKGLVDEAYNALKRGIKVQMIFPANLGVKDILSLTPKLVSRQWYKLLYIFRSNNLSIRKSESDMIYDYMVRDNEELGTAFRDEDGFIKYGLRIQDPSIGKFMANYYDTIWDKAKPMKKGWAEDLKK